VKVGDFGVGFSPLEKEKRWLELYHKKLVNNNITLWAIRGNHDYKPYFDNDPFGLSNIKLVPDYTVLELCGKRILCMGGAVSVDRTHRYTKRQSWGDYRIMGNEKWWHDEVFTLDENKLYEVRGIDIIATHTAPSYCNPDNTFNFGPFVEDIIRSKDPKLREDLKFERSQMDIAFKMIKMNNNPTHHFYGHFHNSDKTVVDCITHRLLNIDEFFEIDIDE
jgi:hypothetical protein